MTKSDIDSVIDRLEKLQSCLRLGNNCDRLCDKCYLYSKQEDIDKAIATAKRVLWVKKQSIGLVQDPY